MKLLDLSIIIGRTDVPDKKLRDFYIDRIYDTFIDEDDLQVCDGTIKPVADSLERRPYSSREFIYELGKYLVTHSVKKIPWFRPVMKTMYPFSVLLFPTAVPALDW